MPRNESRLEQERANAEAETAVKEKNGLSDLGATLNQVQQQIADRYSERLAHVEAKCQAEVSGSHTNEQTTLVRARNDYEALQDEMKRQYEQAVWLADSLLDGEEGRVRDELRKDRNAVDVADLDGKRAEGRACSDRYNVTVELEPPHTHRPRSTKPMKPASRMAESNWSSISRR